MDSFTTISFTSKAPATDIPADNEDTGSGQGSGGYCVVFSRDVPTDEEDTGSGQGSGSWAIVYKRRLLAVQPNPSSVKSLEIDPLPSEIIEHNSTDDFIRTTHHFRSHPFAATQGIGTQVQRRQNQCRSWAGSATRTADAVERGAPTSRSITAAHPSRPDLRQVNQDRLGWLLLAMLQGPRYLEETVCIAPFRGSSSCTQDTDGAQITEGCERGGSPDDPRRPPSSGSRLGALQWLSFCEKHQSHLVQTPKTIHADLQDPAAAYPALSMQDDVDGQSKTQDIAIHTYGRVTVKAKLGALANDAGIDVMKRNAENSPSSRRQPSKSVHLSPFRAGRKSTTQVIVTIQTARLRGLDAHGRSRPKRNEGLQAKLSATLNTRAGKGVLVEKRRAGSSSLCVYVWRVVDTLIRAGAGRRPHQVPNADIISPDPLHVGRLATMAKAAVPKADSISPDPLYVGRRR
ncbi:hypothetical protein DFP72DRAFT_1143116 [Ephemerocybe angulata]|uniref:Uncharacterized protein n=1 Tax=Ephemerocybe angulata TaxID=980116 RepID=A0A8H6HMI6_9AGAR|nr:hypothetical protein DFP72DRAFT_1143116 [Tulosesus angulatus]